MPLLTHDETGAASIARHGALATAEREAATTKMRPQKGAPKQGNGGPKPPKTRWQKIRPWLFGTLGVLVLGPFIAFVIGWMIFPAPTADDTVLKQVSVYNFADSTEQPVATVRPEGDGNRIKVRLGQVSKPAYEAVLATEDKTFFTNAGFDFIGIIRAVFNQLRGGGGGGSTITQQLIKVSTGDDTNSLFRKYKEVVLAVKISKEQTKEEILENYLNTIYFGRGAYGIEAASKAYFDKKAIDLTISEGALLAGVIQGPSIWDPAVSMPDAQRRWNGTLDNMVETGAISAAQRAEQKFPDLPKVVNKDQGNGVPDDDRYKVLQAAKAEMVNKGIVTQEQIDNGGLTVTTTLRHDRQGDAVTAVESTLKGQPEGLRAGLVSVNVKTGAIEAYYGGRGFGTDYANVLAQPGSSFKPFVFAAALQSGKNIGLGTVYNGANGQTLAGQKINNSEGVSCDQCDVKSAMTKSINTVFYKMALDVTIPKVAAAAHAAGIPDDLLKKGNAGLALGDDEVHPKDMAAAFATFAANGQRREPYLVSKVEDSSGRVLYERPSDSPEQALDPKVARNVTESMLDVAQSSRFPLADGRQVAAKTGTVQLGTTGQNKDAWTVGYTPSISTAIWLGTDDNKPIKTSSGALVYGSTLPGPMFQKYMNAALKGTPKETFGTLVPMGQTIAPPAPATSAPPTSNPFDDFFNNGNNDNNDGDEDSGNNRGNDDANNRRPTRTPSG